MVTQATYKKQLRALNECTRGLWVKINGEYSTSAFDWEWFQSRRSEEGLYVHCYKSEGGNGEKKNRWYVYTSEHEPSDLFNDGTASDYTDNNGNEVVYTEEGFRTLEDAKNWAETWGEYFQSLSEENELVTVWEVTQLDRGAEVGTWDYTEQPQVGDEIDPGILVMAVVEIDRERQTMTIEIGYLS